MLQTKSGLVKTKTGEFDNEEVCGNKIRLWEPGFVTTCLYYLFLPSFIISVFWNIAVIIIITIRLLSKFMDSRL